MAMDLIAMIAAAFAAGGIVLFLTRVLRLGLPRWTLPAAAGATMLAYAMWSEYSWFGRMSSTLDDGVVVVATNSGGAPWRPWSYVLPVTDRFIAVDLGRAVPHTTADGQKFLNAYWFGRWSPTRVATVMVDCPGQRALELPPGSDFPVSATPPDEAWTAIPATDPIFKAACAEA